MSGRAPSQRGSKEVEHQRVNVSAKLGDHERNAMGHETTDEVNIATEAVQLGQRDATCARLRVLAGKSIADRPEGTPGTFKTSVLAD
jgi:hypothetical protein